MALTHLGLDPGTSSQADYDKASEMLAAIRPFIKTFDNYPYQRMPEKEFCVSVTCHTRWSFSDVRRNDSKYDVKTFLPKVITPHLPVAWMDYPISGSIVEFISIVFKLYDETKSCCW